MGAISLPQSSLSWTNTYRWCYAQTCSNAFPPAHLSDTYVFGCLCLFLFVNWLANCILGRANFKKKKKLETRNRKWKKINNKNMNILLAYRAFLQIRTAYFKPSGIMQSRIYAYISDECEIRGCWKRAATTKIQYSAQGWPEVGGPPRPMRSKKWKSPLVIWVMIKS